MKTLAIKLLPPPPKQYSIFMAQGLLKSLPKILKQLKPAARYVIITDNIVKKILGDPLVKSLKKSGLTVDLISFPAGEKNKNEKTNRINRRRPAARVLRPRAVDRL